MEQAPTRYVEVTSEVRKHCTEQKAPIILMSNTKEWESACLREDSVHCHFCQSWAWSEVLGNSAKYFHFQLSLNTHNQIHSSEITDIISFSWRAKKNLNENWEMTQPQPKSSKFISLPQNHDLNWITVPQISEFLQHPSWPLPHWCSTYIITHVTAFNLP